MDLMGKASWYTRGHNCFQNAGIVKGWEWDPVRTGEMIWTGQSVEEREAKIREYLLNTPASEILRIKNPGRDTYEKWCKYLKIEPRFDPARPRPVYKCPGCGYHYKNVVRETLVRND